MKRPGFRLNTFIFGLMLLASAVAWSLTPRKFLSDTVAPINLKSTVPSKFGEWEELETPNSQIVDPSSKALIDLIYTETLSKTYVNRLGYRIMLSIAYGRDQRDSLQLHQPEVCYPAQGFEILSKERKRMTLPDREVGITQMTSRLGSRNEPVTYWTMVGEYVYQGNLSKKLAEFRYAKKGLIADGMLFRVSSIDSDTARAFELQQRFSSEFIAALPTDVAPRFAGFKTH